MSEPDIAQVNCPAFKLFTINATLSALWQDARRACDKALAQGLAFVVILREAGALAEEHLLTDEDLQRARRFRRLADRYNFVLGRTMVHHLVRPQGAAVPYAFSLGRHGKPFLPDGPSFNVSHSDNWVACAIGRGELIGVDVETFEHLQDYRELLGTITHVAERQCIDQAPPDRQLALFQRCWTRKEAVLKATGMGLSDDLCSIDVRLTEDEPVLGYPASLRLVDLLLDDERPTISLALDTSVPGVVVMSVL
ncbi:4'-phosphopantetheinyl transferase family protein [Dyella tabacisoli]|uniref:4'-phosphopantetheinyl transferase domain-containing protein n=1 Tax=Dyella tabacisoli TaxID=2282381 RepID=A0A369UJ81_9GAMM|nr:4'-phosphopantetheinyl transferase superfamily protein [Dyella tabacisoli]RDD80596.1 hypothetical protein DVJ77_17130 [Dyella tabacisoli]